MLKLSIFAALVVGRAHGSEAVQAVCEVVEDIPSWPEQCSCSGITGGGSLECSETIPSFTIGSTTITLGGLTKLGFKVDMVPCACSPYVTVYYTTDGSTWTEFLTITAGQSITETIPGLSITLPLSDIPGAGLDDVTFYVSATIETSGTEAEYNIDASVSLCSDNGCDVDLGTWYGFNLGNFLVNDQNIPLPLTVSGGPLDLSSACEALGMSTSCPPPSAPPGDDGDNSLALGLGLGLGLFLPLILIGCGVAYYMKKKKAASYGGSGGSSGVQVKKRDQV